MGDEPDADAPAGHLVGPRRRARSAAGRARAVVLDRPYLLLAPTVIAAHLIASCMHVDEGILPVVMATSSVIVGIAAGFAVRMAQSMNQFRIEKLVQFAGNQDKLPHYGRAFEMLASRIEQACANAPHSNPEGMDEPPQDTSLQNSQLVESLREFSRLSSESPHDFGAIDMIVSKDALDDLVRCIRKIDGSLSDEASLDRFRMAVKASADLGTSAGISPSDRDMEYAAYKLDKGFENDWRRPGFWTERIRDCNKALARMNTAGRHVYDLERNSLKKSGSILFFMAIFGVILPIVTMVAADMQSLSASFLSAASAVGFVSYFAAYLGWVHMRMSSKRIWRF